MVVGGIFREENVTFSDGMTLKYLTDKIRLFELCWRRMTNCKTNKEVFIFKLVTTI